MFKINIKQLFLVVILGFITVSCDDDLVSSPIPDGLTITLPSEYVDGIATIEAENPLEDHGDHDAEHADIGGFQFEEEGQSSPTYSQIGLTTSGAISLSVGETKELAVHFLDSEGNELEDEDSDDSGGDSHDGHGMAVEITGVMAGTTFFQIQLMHEGHADYTSLAIGVTVTE